MPVYDVKLPPPPSPTAPPATDAANPLLPPWPVVRLRHLGRRRLQRRFPRRSPQGPPAGRPSLQGVLALVEHQNRRLAGAGIPIHLRLRQGEDGLELEIHDCTDGHVCRPLHDQTLPLSRLDELVDHLTRGRGLLLDTEA